jgi:RND family efflux transporter MFP subunit
MKQPSTLRRPLLALAVLATGAAALFLILSRAPSAQASQAAPAPPTVTVALVEAREVMEHSDFTGRIEPVDDVELRARVSGHLEAVHFESGQLVERGDLLFTIDRRWNEAALAASEAAIAQARVRLENAELEMGRAEKLLSSRAISAEEAETRSSRLAEARAFVLATEAARDIAQLDLEYTQIKAPIAGRVSRPLVTPGNFVSGVAGANTVLATIVSVDPVLVYVDVDESSLLQLQRRLNEGVLPMDEHGHVLVEVGLSDDEGFPLAGVVESLGNRIDPGTGSILMRVQVPNPDGRLVPGLFARVRVPTSKPASTILISDRAIGTDQSQKFVLVLANDGTAQYRTVEVGPLHEGLRVIRSGLEVGESIVVNGLQRVRPGAPVTAVTQAELDAQAPR